MTTFMKRGARLALLPLALSCPDLLAQQSVTGELIDEASLPVKGATVRAPSLGRGALSDRHGRFTITGIPDSITTLDLRVSGGGWRDTTLRLLLPLREPPVIMLGAKSVLSDPVVVSGNREATYVKDLPVKVEVIGTARLHAVRSIDFTAACEYTPGIKVQNNCGVCGTNDIRTQGLPGQYSQVLINGHPIVSNLGMVYGLMGIGTASIRQIEIVKGPGSVLFGPEAVGGTINIIMRSPREMPPLSIDAQVASNQEHHLMLAGAKRWESTATSLTGDYAGSYLRRDRNGDGFTDAPLFRRLTLMNQWNGSLGGWTFDLTGRYYHEDRFGGEMEWRKERDRGGNGVYGESITTHRQELFGGVERRLSDRLTATAHISETYHHQDSHYGTTWYRAEQAIAYADAMVAARLGERGRLTVGGAYRFERYDDNTSATAGQGDLTESTPSLYHLASLFAEGQMAVADPVTVMLGLRYNHHNLQGSIWQPRVAARIALAEGSTLRLSAGSGFRAVNIFTEDHAALSGARRLVIEEELRPERSINGSVSFIQDLDFGDQFARLTLDGFQTRFSNQIIPDYDSDPRSVIYRNLDGYSMARGVEAGLDYQFAFPLRAALDYEWLEAYQVAEGRRSAIKFNPAHRLFWSLDYDWEEPGLDVNLVGKWVGAQALPEFPEPFPRSGRSEPYAIWNLQASIRLGVAELYGGVSNLFDYRQESPLVDPGHPFGEYFDTSYVYGPLEGRVMFVGVRGAIE